ncbi:polyribonucleotide nucleotidyltransferase [Patescibacteria group bacterium]|nr:polyribonucleotide nucleotidyltransferase [Patescibacteria group bacterium]MBU1931073.1 polyribonucleotide nucleotidyltransferase [Patescibacteria group bacterium]
MIKTSLKINGEELSFEVGNFAHLADAAVLIRWGETVVHAAVVHGNKETELDYFPLSVEYQEKLYAGGIIKGSRWVKREGRPTDGAVLTARLIDRSIRPLFPKEYKKEVQVVVTVFSVDNQHAPDILGILASSAALAISDIPWGGPIAAARLGLIDDQLVVNPLEEQLKKSQLDLVVSGTKEALVMVEAGAKQVSEAKMLEAFELSSVFLGEAVEAIKQLIKQVGKTKETVVKTEVKPEVRQSVETSTKKFLNQWLIDLEKDQVDKGALAALADQLSEELPEVKKGLIRDLIDEQLKQAIRQKLFAQKKRPDGRAFDEIRPIEIKTDLFPRTHGSAMFKRGKTQAVTIVTLGSPSLEQWIESMDGEETKRYIHHYNFPSFSVGEVGRFGWPGRREVGHGALAERALLPLIPDEEAFPYTIRVVSEIMTCNGSSSMASVCGSTLSLMDAGVPLKKPVAGIAMGLVINSKPDDYVILTDIQGLEDHLGDMDFKVAGTDEGITALQMDIKITGISLAVFKDALAQAKKARLFILEEMKKVLPVSRATLSSYAPKIAIVYVPEDKIGEVIGPGGRMIRQIIKETETSVDVNDEGRVTVAGKTKEAVDKAIEWINGLIREVKLGEEFDGQVTRVEAYGIFVEILPGKEGLVHVSRMSGDYVADAGQLYKIGDTVHARVSEVDAMGKIALSMLTPEQEAQKKNNSRDQRPRSFDRRPQQSFQGNSRYSRDSRGGR